MSDRIRSKGANWATGITSGRSFTVEELKAAKALGYADKRHDEWSGRAFWATGEIHLDDLRRLRENIDTFLPAWEREWDKWKEATDE